MDFLENELQVYNFSEFMILSYELSPNHHSIDCISSNQNIIFEIMEECYDKLLYYMNLNRDFNLKNIHTLKKYYEEKIKLYLP